MLGAKAKLYFSSSASYDSDLSHATFVRNFDFMQPETTLTKQEVISEFNDLYIIQKGAVITENYNKVRNKLPEVLAISLPYFEYETYIGTAAGKMTNIKQAFPNMFDMSTFGNSRSVTETTYNGMYFAWEKNNQTHTVFTNRTPTALTTFTTNALYCDGSSLSAGSSGIGMNWQGSKGTTDWHIGVNWGEDIWQYNNWYSTSIVMYLKCSDGWLHCSIVCGHTYAQHDYYRNASFYISIQDTDSFAAPWYSWLDNNLEGGFAYSDPYSGAGYSGTGGGSTSAGDTSDNIGFSSLPTLSMVDCGFLTLFTPSKAQLVNLSNYMWSNAFSLDSLKKLFADPIDTILGLSIFPCSVPAGSLASVHVGNIDTGINMTLCNGQYTSFSCGSIYVKPYIDSYLDYSPYTKIEIFLPYIGVKELNTDDVMGKTITVNYNFDLLSGACVAEIMASGDDGSYNVLYTFNGVASTYVPITGVDYGQMYRAIVGIATSAVGGIAGAASGALTTVGSAVGSTINDVMTAKPIVQKSGSISASNGWIGQKYPYLIITRPNQCLPENQNKFTGYPSFINEKLEFLTGYTVIESIHLESIPALDDELTELDTILKEGVIF